MCDLWKGDEVEAIPPDKMARLPPVPGEEKRGCLMAYKLLLIENARNKLINELSNFTEKANLDVQHFLKSPSPAAPQDHDNILAGLDLKWHTIEKLTAALINSTTDTKLCIKATSDVHKDLVNPLVLCRDKRIMASDVLKFGPMLQSVLMAASIGNAVQVLGATLSLQQLKLFFTDQDEIVNSGVFHCSISSSQNTVIEASTLSTHNATNSKAVKEGVYQEKGKLSANVEPKQDKKELIPTPLSSSSKQPEISFLKPLKLTVGQPLIDQRLENDVHVQHQKQTSSQLMHFLRTNAKIKHIAEVTWIERRDHFQYTSSLNQPAIPVLEHCLKIKCDMSDGQRSIEIPFLKKKLLSEMEIQAPVFKVKGIESSGSLVYTCMIATKTELWDVGDIFTEMPKATSETSIQEKDISPQSYQYHKKDLPTMNLTPNIPSPQATEENLKLEVRSSPQSHPICTTSSLNHVSIPEFQIRKFEETEVVVTHIVSPGDFYIQHSHSIIQQQAVVTDWIGSRFFADQKCIPDIGTYVMGWFAKQERWCRAQVTKICGISGDKNALESLRSVGNIEVEVRRLDYGDTACLSLCSIKELSQDLTVLPLQAIKVSLANVTPVDGSSWSKEAVGWFRDIVENRTLYARLFPLGGKVMVELFLEKGKMGAMRRGASLSLRLAQNGHAKHDKLKKLGVRTSTAQVQMKKRESAWEKYVLSYYTQNNR